jgi:hypothetical protein
MRSLKTIFLTFKNNSLKAEFKKNAKLNTGNQDTFKLLLFNGLAKYFVMFYEKRNIR